MGVGSKVRYPKHILRPPQWRGVLEIVEELGVLDGVLVSNGKSTLYEYKSFLVPAEETGSDAGGR